MMRLIVVAVIAGLLAACGAGEDAAAPPAAENASAAAAPQSSQLEALPGPAGAGAAEPFLAATRDGVLMTWLEPVAGSDRVALRVSRFQGDRWSAPATIVERNDLFVNWADFPSVVEDAKGTLYAHWLQKNGAGTYAYDVQMSTSADGGATWRAPFLLNRDGKQAEHGFVTLAALPDGGVGATWLDGRNMGAGGHEGHDAGDMTLRYATVSADGAIADDVELDTRTCECCATGMAMTGDGPVIVYRDRSPEEIRDISYVKRTAAGWSAPQSVNADGWKINACPVNGPQIDAIGNRAATGWFTAAQEKARAYVAFSNDGGATFGKPVRIDEGKPIGRLDIVMLDEEAALVTWIEQTAGGGEIRARRVTESGAEPARKIADSSTARAAGFPRIARVGRDVYFTWTEQDATSKKVQVARSRF
jgi:hypothetical protein